LTEEFERASRELSDKKATGIDKTPTEIIKNLDEDTKNFLFKILNDAYENGVIPTDFTHSKTIKLPKKENFSVYLNYRTIALLSQPSKILLNIVKNIIKKKIDERIDEDQFGYRNGRGTREAIVSLREIMKRRIEMDKSTHVAFVDLEKAFDKIDWNLLFMSLQNAGIY
jgi:hypothetical protein